MSELSRRSVLVLSVSAALMAMSGAPAVAATAGAVPNLAGRRSPAHRGRSSYQVARGSRVMAAGPGRRVPLVLAEVATPRFSSRELTATEAELSFTLIFDRLDDAPFAEGIHRVFGPKFLAESLLLSPFGPTGDRQQLQAVINRTR